MALLTSNVMLMTRPWANRVAWAVVAGLVAYALLAAFGDRHLFEQVFAATSMFGLYGLLYLFVAWHARSVPVAGDLAAGEHGVLWNGRLLATRAQITAGFVIPADRGAPEVRLVRRFPRRPITFLVPDELSGRELLGALGLDASQTVASFKLASLLRARWYATVGNLGCLVALPASLIMVLMANGTGAIGGAVRASMLGLGALAWIVFNMIPARARVGADGVLVEWLWQRTFVAFEELTSARVYVDANNAGVALALRDGREVLLPAMGLFTAEIAREELTLMVKRIEQAAEVHRRSEADRGVKLPPRGERSAREWLEVLRAMGSGASADHRTAPVEADTLFRIAEDPGTEPARRIAAAVALSGGMDEAGRSRLRIAASTTAAPELREVLELAASEAADEEAIAAAIERVATAKA